VTPENGHTLPVVRPIPNHGDRRAKTNYLPFFGGGTLVVQRSAGATNVPSPGFPGKNGVFKPDFTHQFLHDAAGQKSKEVAAVLNYDKS
jgi:hypothetical protein